MGLEKAEGVEMKSSNAGKALSTPLIPVDAEASLLRPLGLAKPKVVGQVVSTQLEVVGSLLSDGLRLGPPKLIFAEASGVSRPFGQFF